MAFRTSHPLARTVNAGRDFFLNVAAGPACLPAQLRVSPTIGVFSGG